MTRALLSLAALLLLALLALAPTDHARADELLRIESAVTYDVRPDAGPIHVSWRIALENNDPATERRSSGQVSFYESLTVPVLRGAVNLEATGPSGTALDVAIDSSGAGPVDIAEVSFDRNLYYEETYTLDLSYDILEARSDVLLATESYVFLPAITSGDASDVTLITTDSAGWDVTIEPVDCVTTVAGPLQCGPSDYVQLAAFVEVARSGVLTGSDFAVPLEAGDLMLSLQFFPGEEAWAGHIREIAESAIPRLEELFGAAYDGPRVIEVAERGRQDIAGYEGTFGCIVDSCIIGISPLADDLTAVHEFAHLWTQPFENRWIAEGLAEYASVRVANDLAELVAPFELPAPARLLDFPLDDWGRSRYLIGATQNDLDVEASGYYRSRNFFQQLEEEIGLEALQQANRAAAEIGGGVDTQTYFDLLDEASGVRLDDLFLGTVFPESFAPTLERRANLHDRLDLLREGADAGGFALPARMGQFLDEWDFDEADVLISAAEDALEAYTAADARVSGSRSVLERIGLIGKDPESTLDEAADAFSAAEFSRSQRLSQDAIDEIDDASQQGLIRALIAGGIIALVLVGLLGLFWIAVSRPSAR